MTVCHPITICYHPPLAMLVVCRMETREKIENVSPSRSSGSRSWCPESRRAASSGRWGFCLDSGYGIVGALSMMMFSESWLYLCHVLPTSGFLQQLSWLRLSIALLSLLLIAFWSVSGGVTSLYVLPWPSLCMRVSCGHGTACSPLRMDEAQLGNIIVLLRQYSHAACIARQGGCQDSPVCLCFQRYFGVATIAPVFIHGFMRVRTW